MEYAALQGQAGANVTIQQLGFQTDFSVYLQIRQTWLAFSQYSITYSSRFHSLTCRCKTHMTPSCSSLSDYPGHCGGHHPPPAHLPQEENLHRHRSHQRSQQVRLMAPMWWWKLNRQISSDVVVFTEPSDTWCVPFSTRCSPSSSWP